MGKTTAPAVNDVLNECFSCAVIRLNHGQAGYWAKHPEELKQALFDTLSSCPEDPEERAPALEDHNFRVPSDGWARKTDPHNSGQQYLEAPTGDIWELINCKDPKLNGEQLFTWKAAMRETKKAGKRMPTDEEWDKLLQTRDDMPHPVFAGYRNGYGSFSHLSGSGTFWSSLGGGSGAWYRTLYSSTSTVSRSPYGELCGFSARCLKE